MKKNKVKLDIVEVLENLALASYLSNNPNKKVKDLCNKYMKRVSKADSTVLRRLLDEEHPAVIVIVSVAKIRGEDHLVNKEGILGMIKVFNRVVLV